MQLKDLIQYMIEKEDAFKIKEIRRKSLALIDLHIGMIYDENFES
jgi:hypothetical protein